MFLANWSGICLFAVGHLAVHALEILPSWPRHHVCCERMSGFTFNSTVLHEGAGIQTVQESGFGKWWISAPINTPIEEYRFQLTGWWTGLQVLERDWKDYYLLRMDFLCYFMVCIFICPMKDKNVYTDLLQQSIHQMNKEKLNSKDSQGFVICLHLHYFS